MASFFRKRIAQKVIPFLLKSHANSVEHATSVVSSFVKVNRLKGQYSQLVLPWKKLCNSKLCLNTEINPTRLVTMLKNQGLPTAEGFTDIELDESFHPLLIFTVDKHVFSKIVLMDISINSENLAKSSCLFENILPKKVLVSCRSCSVGNSFNTDHFRSEIHSKFIANIHKFVGHEVLHMKHVEDSGLDAAILLAGYKKFGSEEKLNKNPAIHLSQILKAAKLLFNEDLQFHEEVDKIFDEMNKGDTEATSDWNNLRSSWMQHYDSVYTRLGIHHDVTHFDSSCNQDVLAISQKLLDNQFVSVDENGQVKIIENEINKEPFPEKAFCFPLHLLSKYMYTAILNKEKHKFDLMYCIAPTDQKFVFESVSLLLKKIGYKWSEQIKYIKLKNIRSFENKKLKYIEDVLEKAKLNMLNQLHKDLQLEMNESLEEMAEILSISSLYINDMKHRRNVDYEFLWEDILSFGKDSAACFQFCYSGLKGLQEDSEYKFKIDVDTSPLFETPAHSLVRHLSRFDEIVYKSYLQLEPCIIIEYLSSLWYFTNNAANVLRLDIKEDKLRVIKARLLLLDATLKVLRTGLELLGVTPMENKYTVANNIEDEI